MWLTATRKGLGLRSLRTGGHSEAKSAVDIAPAHSLALVQQGTPCALLVALAVRYQLWRGSREAFVASPGSNLLNFGSDPCYLRLCHHPLLVYIWCSPPSSGHEFVKQSNLLHIRSTSEDHGFALAIKDTPDQCQSRSWFAFESPSSKNTEEAC